MSLTQGSPLPNITTTQGQTTTAPSWYTDYLSNLASQGTSGAQNAQYIGATPLQEQAFQSTQQNVGNYQPALTAATNLANQAGNYDVAQAAGNYMNPYTQNVVNALGTIGQRNINQYLAPQATAAAVGSGQFGSKRGAEVLGQAINTGLQNLNAAQAQALQTGYTQALQAAQNEQANRLAASQQLGTLAGTTQNLGLADVNALATLGAQQQQIAQNEQLFPLQTASQQAALLRGYTIPTSTSATYTGPIPGAYSASPLSQIAGIGSLMAASSGTDLGKAIGRGIGGISWDKIFSSGNTNTTDTTGSTPADYGYNSGSLDNYTGIDVNPTSPTYGDTGSANVPDWWWTESYD